MYESTGTQKKLLLLKKRGDFNLNLKTLLRAADKSRYSSVPGATISLSLSLLQFKFELNCHSTIFSVSVLVFPSCDDEGFMSTFTFFSLMLLLLFNILPSSTTLFRAVDQRSSFFLSCDNFYSVEGEGSIKHLY